MKLSLAAETVAKEINKTDAGRITTTTTATQESADKVQLYVAPPQPALAAVAQRVNIPVLCQHLDDASVGSSTGFMVPEIAKSFGAAGSLINHSEHRIPTLSIENLVKRLRSLAMTSIVCARTAEEVAIYSHFQPDFIAIEPPELIGSGKAVSKENPSIITDSVKANSESQSKLICGAGISDSDDVRMAMRLGSKGILVASSIVKSKSWPDKIAQLVSGLSG